MGEYYEYAEQVIVWLGMGSVGELLAVDDIRQFNAASSDTPRGYTTLSAEENLYTLCVNPYFTRLWVMQEVVFATEIVVLLGNNHHRFESMKWNDLVEAHAWADSAGLIDVVKSIRNHSPLARLQGAIATSLHTDMFSLINTFYDYKCADPRDKLFALSGIVPIDKNLFNVDYGKSVKDVYLDFCAVALLSDKVEHPMKERSWDILIKLGQAMGFDQLRAKCLSHGPSTTNFLSYFVNDYTLKT
jgi:hypothetical protein